MRKNTKKEENSFSAEARERAEQVMKRLSKRYSEGAFPGRRKGTSVTQEMKDPFRVLISTILSQRTRDPNTHLASERLFQSFPTMDDIASARLEDIEELIRPAGFYKAKAAAIKEISQKLIGQHSGSVPKDIESLLDLPAVGRKTANCVLVYGFGEPAIPVDTHVHRISNRLGIVGTRTPEATERELEKVVPRKYWLKVNKLFVRFGQEICRPRNPKCIECELADLCESYASPIKGSD